VTSTDPADRMAGLVAELEEIFVLVGLEVDNEMVATLISELPDLVGVQREGVWEQDDAKRVGALVKAALTMLAAQFERVAAGRAGLDPVGECVQADPSALVYRIYGKNGSFTICGHAPAHRGS
jgi:hypothetical protein